MLKKDISGIFLVAGTSIGGAMLALPVTAAKLGLIVTSFYLIMVALIMGVAGLLLIPLYEKYGSLTIVGLAKKKLGKPWDLLATVALASLLYCLMVAYLSGLGGSFASLTGLSWQASLLLISFTLLFSLTFSSKIIDLYNSSAFIIKVVVLLGIFFILSQAFQVSSLEKSIRPLESAFLVSLPILVTSFGFHGSASFIFKLLGPDHYKKAVIRGTTLTLVIYLLWVVLILGFLPADQVFAINNLEEFLSLLDASNNNPYLIKGLKIFYNLAVATSLFGVSVGLFDFLEEKLPKARRVSLAGMVFLIPLLFNFLNKNLFLQALNLAGIALTFIAIIIPSLLLLKEKIFPRYLLIFFLLFGLLVSLGEIIALLGL
jgi:tyrosine-specific transport protein